MTPVSYRLIGRFIALLILYTLLYAVIQPIQLWRFPIVVFIIQCFVELDKQ